MSAPTATGISVLDSVFVPEHRSVSFATLRDACSPGSKLNTNPIYRTPFIAVHTYALLGPALGLARSGYADFVQWTRQRYLTYTQLAIAQQREHTVGCALQLPGDGHPVADGEPVTQRPGVLLDPGHLAGGMADEVRPISAERLQLGFVILMA